MVAIGIGTSFGSLQNIFCNTPDGPAVVVCCKGRHALDEDFNSIRLFSVDSCVPLASTLPIFEYNGLPFLGSDSTAYLPRTARYYRSPHPKCVGLCSKLRQLDHQ